MIIGTYLSSAAVLALLASLEISGAQLSPDVCSGADIGSVYSSAVAVVDKVSEKLLKSGAFSRSIQGFAFLAVDSSNANSTGGGTNPDGAYVTYAFEKNALPDGMCESIPTHMNQEICHFQETTPIGNNVTWTANFVLSPSDAVLFYGCTPPPLNYFGWDPLINARLTEEYPYYPGTNFGNALSFRRINVSSPDIYSQPISIVHTADGKSAAQVNGAFAAAGVDKRAMSTHALDSSEIKFMDRTMKWQESKPDILTMLQRVTEPKQGYKDAYGKYKKLFFPVTLLLAEPGKQANEPLTPPLITRSTKRVSKLPTEKELLGEALQDLYQAVKSFYVSPSGNGKPTSRLMGSLTNELTDFGYYDDWDQVLAQKNNLTYVAPTRDATYGVGQPTDLKTFGVHDHSAAVMIGVVHTNANGTANVVAYSSAGVSLWDGWRCNSVIDCPSWRVNDYHQSQWLNHNQLLGSAQRYFDKAGSPQVDPALASQLFAIDYLPGGACSSAAYSKFHSSWCLEFSKDALRRFPKHPNIPLGRHTILPILGERMYSQESTDSGPAADEVLPARMLSFSFD